VSPDLIGRYLDRLLAHLRGSASDVRRILAEAEEHLRDATAERVAAGAGEQEAQRQAIEAFGDPRTVARRFAPRLAPVPVRAVLAELVRTGTLLGAVALVAIGVSGALAELLGRAFGAAFVAGDVPGSTYTAERCADFMEYFPHARSCLEAAALHHWGEVVEYRVAAGVLGLLVLGGYRLWRRRGREAGYLGVLPDAFAATVATSLYGVAAAVLLLETLNGFVLGRDAGSGQYLSAAIVALVMAAVYGATLSRSVLGRARSSTGVGAA
jgi:hypothetical protein